LVLKTNQLIVYGEITAACSEIYKKHINTLYNLVMLQLVVQEVITRFQRVNAVQGNNCCLSENHIKYKVKKILCGNNAETFNI